MIKDQYGGQEIVALAVAAGFAAKVMRLSRLVRHEFVLGERQMTIYQP